MDIEKWLRGLGLEQYADAFAANDIDLSLLGQLTDADLKELGVQSLGHRKRILAAATASLPTAAPLSPQPADDHEVPADERRQVTILFADLCGYTMLSRSLDPEDLRALIGRYTALVDGIVLAYGGTIDKHIGDAVMALFGAPRSHETDTLRAARAALDIHDGVARLATQTGRALQAHIGIASGEVIAGALGRADAQDYTVHGDPVNLAARLVAAAPAGETWLSDDAARTLGDVASCEAIGERRFKGIDTPVQPWRLVALGSEPVRTSHSHFVGREAELEQFHGILHACMAKRAGHVVHVRGEAGIGKTRLVDEMRRHAQAQGFTLHRSLVLDFGVGKGQDPVRTIIGSLLGLPAGASSEARQAAAAQVAAEGIVKAEQIVFLHDFLDLPQSAEWQTIYEAMDHGARKRGKQALAARLTEDACAHAATLIVVEDLHWADAEVIGYLSAFASGIANGTGLLVTTSRVEGDPIDAGWRARCRDTPFADRSRTAAQGRGAEPGGQFHRCDAACRARLHRARGRQSAVSRTTAAQRRRRQRQQRARVDPQSGARADGPARASRPPGVPGGRRDRPALRPGAAARTDRRSWLCLRRTARQCTGAAGRRGLPVRARVDPGERLLDLVARAPP
ncbi:adenylate/guanylate cyclase domain-containing protein [Paraburkholderia youngii]|uniref:adenylate/guanylate cyclase domain-containing protein n=1 Tax=Paraburkholderia youngii TaxID=2782701 RepID=UPI003D19EDB0